MQSVEKGRRLRVRHRYGEPGIEALFTRVDDTSYEAYCRERGLIPDPASATPNECMVIAAARQSPDGAFFFVGTGLPMIGSMLAQHTYAPDAVMIMESGIVGPRVRHLPISVSDPRASYQSTMVGSMSDAFGTIAMRGYCTAGILGAAECDRYGNLNSMGISYGQGPGKGRRPRVRLAGSGGANPIASLADFVLVMMLHERRRFPERCEHLTSPTGARGPFGSPEDRWRSGLYRGRRTVVVTDLGILRTDTEGTGELLLDALHAGTDERRIHDNTGWPLRRSPTFHVMDPPTREELKILRFVVDPARVYLGRRGRE
jgi:glutaconate CoA-transferase, subunit B